MINMHERNKDIDLARDITEAMTDQKNMHERSENRLPRATREKSALKP